MYAMRIFTDEYALEVNRTEGARLTLTGAPEALAIFRDTVELAGTADDEALADAVQPMGAALSVTRGALSLFLSFEVLNTI